MIHQTALNLCLLAGATLAATAQHVGINLSERHEHTLNHARNARDRLMLYYRFYKKDSLKGLGVKRKEYRTCARNYGSKSRFLYKRTLDGISSDQNKYRLGLRNIGLGPYQIGVNSEWIRHNIQNRFAHDFLQSPPSPWFQVFPGYPQLYLGFNSGTQW